MRSLCRNSNHFPNFVGGLGNNYAEAGGLVIGHGNAVINRCGLTMGGGGRGGNA